MRYKANRVAGYTAALAVLSILAFCLVGCGGGETPPPAGPGGMDTRNMPPGMAERVSAARSAANQPQAGPGAMPETMRLKFGAAGPPMPGQAPGGPPMPGPMGGGMPGPMGGGMPGQMGGAMSPMGGTGFGATAAPVAPTATTAPGAPSPIPFSQVPLRSAVRTTTEKGLQFLNFKYLDLQNRVQTAQLPKAMSLGSFPHPDWINTFDMYKVGDSAVDARRRAEAEREKRRRAKTPPRVWQGVAGYPLISPRSVSTWPAWALPRQQNQYGVAGALGRAGMPGMPGAGMPGMSGMPAIPGRPGMPGMPGMGTPGLPAPGMGTPGGLLPGGMTPKAGFPGNMPGLPGPAGLPAMGGFSVPTY